MADARGLGPRAERLGGSSPPPPTRPTGGNMGLFTSLKSDKAKTKKLKEEGCVVTLSVEIPPQEVTDQTQTSLVRLQSRARIPGFRSGKAPLDVVKQRFTGHAREEALDALIRKH